MGLDSKQRRAKGLRTDPKLRPGDPGRFAFEQNALEAQRGRTGSDDKGGKPGQTFQLPVRTGGRATLVERENPDEFLEFHWDPTSYNISKQANWTFKSVPIGTDIAEYTGCGATVVTFNMFLNDIGQPHKIQRSVEDSIEWLFNRLRPRDEAAVARRGADRTRNRRWISQHDPAAAKRPPILVLFGLRDGFECVMTSLELKTIFQAPPLGGEFGNVRSRTSARELELNLRGGSRVSGPVRLPNEPAHTVGGKAIIRATIAITLKEFVNAPAVG